MYESLERGLSFKSSQGSFIPLSPPLNIEEEDLSAALGILEDSLEEVSRSDRA